MFKSAESDLFKKRGQWLKENPSSVTVFKYGIGFTFTNSEQAKRMEQQLAVMTANQVRQLHFEIYGNSTHTAQRRVRGQNGG